ncbi:hypothetical protein G0U57_017015, partial [Chelydra serpentina]
SPPLSPARPLSADALRTQCEFLEKSRLKLLKAQDGKKVQTMESLISIVPSQISVSSMPRASALLAAHSLGKLMGRPGSGASGVADEEGAPRKAGPSPKIKPEASKKEKHR